MSMKNFAFNLKFEIATVKRKPYKRLQHCTVVVFPDMCVRFDSTIYVLCSLALSSELFHFIKYGLHYSVVKDQPVERY